MLRDNVKLLTVHQTARRLGVAEETVRRKLKSGELPGLRLGAGPRAPYRIDESELRDWLYGPQDAGDSSRRSLPARAPLASDAYEVVDLRAAGGAA
jgi:excisionase family DNA binding protein